MAPKPHPISHLENERPIITQCMSFELDTQLSFSYIPSQKSEFPSPNEEKGNAQSRTL